MTMPGDSDDDWAELARELARDKPQPQSDDFPTPPEEEGVFGEGGPDVSAEPEGPDEDEPAGAGETEAEAVPDGLPGTGRKRRRRRRRRRKGGEQPGEAAAPVASGEEEPVESAEDEPADYESSDVGFADEGEPEPDDELAPSAVDEESDEDAGEDLLRDLTANWNVPSWDDVVAGLYRPER
jgi:hypothetical protein